MSASSSSSSSSMMFISLLLLSSVSTGLTVAAPRLGPGNTSGTLGADPQSRRLAPGLTPAPVAIVASSGSLSPPAPASTGPGTATLAHTFGLTGARKRSTDVQRSGVSREKRLQTLESLGGSVMSPGSVNDAWAADNNNMASDTSTESHELVCNCSSGSEGILDPDECDPSTGQCSCVSGYSGLQCDDCEDGHFSNGSSGCLPCACDSYGAVSALCDSSGVCVCKPGVYGPKCDECHPGFFHFSSTGCRPCQCHNHTNNCHPQSGVCLNCEGNTQGSNCEDCSPTFYRPRTAPPTHACMLCPCSNTSSTGSCHTDSSGSPVCDQCHPRYSGPHCNRCSSGFYRSFGECVPCDCSGNGDPQGGAAELCHPDTGHCLRCVNGTTGIRCHLCAPGFNGDARYHNCTHPAPRFIPPTQVPSLFPPSSSTPPPPLRTTPSTKLVSSTSNNSFPSSTSTSSQALLPSMSGPTDNTTAALTEVSWTQFNVIVLAVIILAVLLLLGFVGGVYTYREYQNRKLNAPFWTIELKEDNISFSSYHDSIPNADVSGLLEDEANEVAPNGQLALATPSNCYKA